MIKDNWNEYTNLIKLGNTIDHFNFKIIKEPVESKYAFWMFCESKQ